MLPPAHDAASHGLHAYVQSSVPRRRISNSQSAIPEYLWRLFHREQMDLENTYSQMINLLRSPSDVYKSTKYRKQIKNQWARDDPAFVAIQILFIAWASLAYCLAFGVVSFAHFIRIVIGSVVIEFLGVGVVVATAGRYIANKYMRVQRMLNVEQEVEWLYAFDIHCNGFFPVFILLYVVQFFLSPFLIQDNFVATLSANTLWAFALSYYHYISFLGYSVLPNVQNGQKFLYPIAFIGIAYVVSLVLRVNLCRTVLTYYFGVDELEELDT